MVGTEAAYEAAAALLDKDTAFEIRVTYVSEAFRGYLRKNRPDEEWYARAFFTGEIGKQRFWPYKYLHTIRQYLLAPWRPRQALYDFAKAKAEALKNRDGKDQELVPNERLASAWELLEVRDQDRQELLGLNEGDVLKAMGDQPVYRQKSYAARLLRANAQIHLKKTLPPYRHNMWVEIEKLAGQASDFWSAAEIDFNNIIQAVAGVGADILFVTPGALERDLVATDPLFAPLRAVLASVGQPDGLFAVETDFTLPEPEVYAQRVANLSAALGLTTPGKGVVHDLQMKLLQVYETREGLTGDLGRALGWVFVWLSRFQRELSRYDPRAEKAAAGVPVPDERRYHRLWMARILVEFGQWTGLGELIAACGKVVRAEDQPESYIAVRGHWKPESGVPISQMAEDFPGNLTVPFQELPLTVDILVYLYQTDYLHEVATQLQDTLLKDEQDLTQAAPLDQLEAAVTQVGRPQRYKPGEFQIALKVEDRGKIPVQDLLSKNAYTQAELAQRAVQDGIGADYTPLYSKHLVADEFDRSHIFVWLLPDLRRIVVLLRGIDGVEELVGDAEMSAEDWLARLTDRARAGPAFFQLLAAAVKKARAKAQGRLGDTLRRVSTLERRILAVQLVDPLRAFADNPRVEHFTIPADVVNRIATYYRAVQPPLDAPAQVAALMLALAPEFKEAFKDVDRAARLPPISYTFLKLGIDFASDQDKQQVVKSILFEDATDPAGSEQLAPLLANQKDLEAVLALYEEASKKLQTRFGFQSEDGVKLKSLVYYPDIEPGPKGRMEIDGVDWELVEVHRPFVYHPALRTAAGGASAKPILTATTDEKAPHLPIRHEPLVTFLVEGEEKTVYADDAAILEFLSRAIEDRAFAIQMENLAEIVEQSAMFMIDAVELVPGAGQELMAARIAIQVTNFIANELPALLGALRDAPLDFIKDLIANLASKYLTPEHIFEFLILGGGNPLASKRKVPDRTPARSRPRGKLGQIIQVLRRLGGRIADAITWLRMRLRGPIRSLQSLVVTRPRLAWLIGWAVDLALLIADIIPPELFRKEGDSAEILPAREAVVEGVAQEGKDFKTRLEEFMEHLQEMELPGEIFPLELAVNVLLDFVIRKMGAKVRLAKKVLDLTGATDAIVKELTDAVLRNSMLDPNTYWRSKLLPEVDESFRKGRNSLVDALYDIIWKVAEVTDIEELKIERVPPKDVGDFQVQRGATPEAELFPSTTILPTGETLEDIPLTPGQPLAIIVRTVEEQRFGHDFGHVRLHTGTEADRPTRALGADALTTGSHIFLRQGLSLTEGRGAEILRHELMHVLQQTGPRPLGKNHDERPVRGRPGRGLVFDQAREAAANLMARARSAAPREPVEVGGEETEGLQPTVTDVGVDILKKLIEFQEAKKFELATGAKVPGQADAEQVWKNLENRLNGQSATDFAPYLRNVMGEVVAHIKRVGITAEDVAAVANLAQRPAKGEKGPRPRTELDIDRFVTLLEGAIFGKTGVSVQFTIDKKRAVTSLAVGYIHMGVVDPVKSKKLWDEALQTPGIVPAGESANAVKFELYTWLALVGPNPFLWDQKGSDFRFSKFFVEYFQKVRGTRRPEVEKQLPTKQQYLSPTPQTGLGLRLGVHQGQQGPDHESHHMTQFLLIQFFRNNATRTAWLGGKNYPGIQPATGQDRSEFDAGSGRRLGLQALDDASSVRGAKMPAILLAADTHRRGQLHIEREHRWDQGDDAEGPATQGLAIEKRWKEALTAAFGVNDSDPTWNARVATTSDPGGKIFDAMIDVYHWMYWRMMPALQQGLKTRELAYYQSIAAHKFGAAPTGQYQMTAADMESVYQNAKKKNDELMSKQGWKTP
jgi:hypothetical protein